MYGIHSLNGGSTVYARKHSQYLMGHTVMFLPILQAVEDLHGSAMEGREVYVGRAQKKAERQSELKEKFERIKLERINRFQVNVKIVYWEVFFWISNYRSKSYLWPVIGHFVDN